MKEELGHWDRDVVIGANHDGVLLILVESVTKFIIIEKLPSKMMKKLRLTLSTDCSVVFTGIKTLQTKNLSLTDKLNKLSHSKFAVLIIYLKYKQNE